MEMECSEVQNGHLTGLNCQIFTNQNANVPTDLSQRHFTNMPTSYRYFSELTRAGNNHTFQNHVTWAAN